MFQTEIENKEAQKQLDKLNQKIDKTTEKLNSAKDKRSGIEQQLDKAAEAAEKTRQKVKDLQAELAKEQQRGAASMLGGTKTAATYDSEQRQAALAEQLKAQEAALKVQTKEADKISGQYLRADEAVKSLTSDLESTQAAAGKVQEKIHGAIPAAKVQAAVDAVGTSLKKSLKNILKWGLGIRSVFILVRRLRSTVTQGLKEMANYDAGTRKHLDSLKNGLTGMKASLTSMMAPVLAAIEPVLTRIMGLITALLDKIGMFFAALRGDKTYTKATAVQAGYAQSLEQTAEAAKEAKKYLSGLDEIRTYDTDKDTSSAGGAGGGSGSGIVSGVEQLEIPDRLINGVGWVKDHMDALLKLAIGIGAVLLGWRIGTSIARGLKDVNDVMALIGGHKEMLAGLILVLEGLIIATGNFIDAWKDGLGDGTLAGIIGGFALIVAGLAIPFKAVGAAIGLIIGAIALLVIGIHDCIQAGEITTHGIFAIIAALLALAGALFLLGAPVAAIVTVIVAAVTAIVLTIVKNWDKIKALFATIAKAIVDWVHNQIAGYKRDWEQIKALARLAWTAIKGFFGALKADITAIIAQIISTVKSKVTSGIDTITQKFETFKDKISNIVDRIRGLFNFSWDFPRPKMPHFTWSWRSVGGLFEIPDLYIDWYARGGIVDGATLIGAGEQGKEAIVPLERHTEWIRNVAVEIADILTDRLGSIMTSYPMPAVVTGTMIPPRIQVDLDGLDAIGSKLDRILDRMQQRGGDYRFTAEINRRTLFDEMISEGRIRQSASGKNPFMGL